MGTWRASASTSGPYVAIATPTPAYREPAYFGRWLADNGAVASRSVTDTWDYRGDSPKETEDECRERARRFLAWLLGELIPSLGPVRVCPHPTPPPSPSRGARAVRVLAAVQWRTQEVTVPVAAVGFSRGSQVCEDLGGMLGACSCLG